MPRKTKKQKIVSDYRRRLTELEFRSPSIPRSPREARPVKPTELKLKDVDEKYLVQNKQGIVRDLRRTVLWSVVAISAEVVLYFVT